jgi:hypothetical protein
MICDLIPIEKQLNTVGLSLFAEEGAVDELGEVANYMDGLTGKNKRKALDEFLTTDVFKDEEAVAFAESRIRKEPLRTANKYANALSDLAKPIILAKAEERDAKHDSNLSTSEKIIRKNIAAKKERLDKVYSDMVYDAYNYFNNWVGGFPIDINKFKSKEELNNALMPYFEKESDYKKYMSIVNYCNQYSENGTTPANVRFIYDGDSVFFPAKTKFELNSNGQVTKMNTVPNGLKELRGKIKSLGFKSDFLTVTPQKSFCFKVKPI